MYGALSIMSLPVALMSDLLLVFVGGWRSSQRDRQLGTHVVGSSALEEVSCRQRQLITAEHCTAEA
jgi:hypothetical protein